MKNIDWKPEYSVGVGRLDKQHQKIIQVINRLIENPNLFDNYEGLNDVLLELTNYVSQHFLLEEQLLEENGYPDLLKHSEKHTAYGVRVAQYCLDTLHEKSNPEELLQFLSKWWIDHILYEDMKYKPFFKSRGVI